MMNAHVRLVQGVLAAWTLTALSGCGVTWFDTEPTLHDDVATYPAAEPIPLRPIPGADVDTWVEAIETLDLGYWASTGEPRPDPYTPAAYEPAEDSRIEADRRLWALEALVPHEAGDFTVTARTVTDTDEGVLSMYCEAQYDIYSKGLPDAATSLAFDGVGQVLQACARGFDNDAVGSKALADWVGEQMAAAEAAYEADERHNRFSVEERFDVDGLLVWCTSDEHRSAVSIVVDPRPHRATR